MKNKSRPNNLLTNDTIKNKITFKAKKIIIFATINTKTFHQLPRKFQHIIFQHERLDRKWEKKKRRKEKPLLITP